MVLFYGFLLFVLGQALIWFQSNGQFIWPWFKNNPIIISIVGGTIISYIFIKATAFVVEYFDGLFWPGRFIAFASGMLVFTIFTWLFFGEGINLKTGISLALATALIIVQLFWKI
jgi:hypothetical protein